jgi:KRAB domain-containing zinc finger protein
VIKNSLKDHLNVHLGLKPYQCEEHSSAFHTKKALRDHMYQHIVSYGASIPCDECNRLFTKKYDSCLKHKEKEKVFPCGECKNMFADKYYNCLRHRKDKIHPCGECKKLFSKKNSDCSKHTFVCKKGCGYKTTKGKSILKSHNLSSRCDPQKYSFICLFCEKGFSTEKYKMKHEREHSEGKPHECNHCFIKFTQRHALIKHLRRKHKMQLVWDTARREYC